MRDPTTPASSRLLQACAIASGFNQACAAGGGTAQWLRKALPLPFRLADEAAYGLRFPDEARALCRLAEAGELPMLGGVKPHLFGTPFISADERSAFQQVLAGDLGQLFPLHWSCHLTGLAPMAYTGTSYEVHLVHLEAAQDGAPVYEDGSGGLRPTRASLAGCWAAELLREVRRDPGGPGLPPDALPLLRDWAQAPPLPAARPIDDPLHLSDRSLWLLKALTDDDSVDLRQALPQAPPMQAFDEEAPELACRPSLALYWLGAQALLGRPGGFDRACDLTASHPSTLVRSMRGFLIGWVQAGRTGPLTALDPGRTARMLSDLRAIRGVDP